MNRSHPFHVFMREVFIPVHVLAVIVTVALYVLGGGA
jgi:hypothetical protein